MTVVKNSVRVSRLDGNSSPGSRWADEDEVQTASEESEALAASSDADSGMGSDEVDASELGEAGEEIVQVGNQSCSMPLELYDLADLGSVLSLETWNNCLTEEERFTLSELLPDMDKETFGWTLKELFTGKNFHFGSPISTLFNQLKGGMCDPKIILYRQGLVFFQRHKHYHRLREYQNSMVGSLIQIRDAWQNCAGYGIEERLRFLNIIRNQRSLGYEKDGDAEMETDLESDEDFGDQFRQKRFKMGPGRPNYDKKENSKGVLRVAAQKASNQGHRAGVVPHSLAVKHGVETKGRAGYDLGAVRRARHQMIVDGDILEGHGYEIGKQGDWNAAHGSEMFRAGLTKPGKKQEFMTRYKRGTFRDDYLEGNAGSPYYQDKGRNADQSVTVASYDPQSFDTLKKKYPGREWTYHARGAQHQVMKGNQMDWLSGNRPVRHNKVLEEVVSLDHSGKSDDWNIKRKKWKGADEYKSRKIKVDHGPNVRSYKNISVKMDDSNFSSELKAKVLQGKIRGKYAQYDGMGLEYSRGANLFAQSEETESDSSEQVEEGKAINTSTRRTEFYPYESVKSVPDSKRANRLMDTDKKVYARIPPVVEPYAKKGKHKDNMIEPSYLSDIKLMKKGTSENLQPSVVKSHTAEKKRKGMVHLDHSSRQANYANVYDRSMLDESGEILDGSSKSVDNERLKSRSAERVQVSVVHNSETDHRERSSMPLLGCNSATKKPKGKADASQLDESGESFYWQSSPAQQIDNTNIVRKKGKRKAGAGNDASMMVSDLVIPEKVTVDVEPVNLQKKPFTLITPTIHTGFSFSIIHLLSSVRKAMVTHIEDSTLENHLEKDSGRLKLKKDEWSRMHQVSTGTCLSQSHEKMDIDTSEDTGQNNLSSLTLQEIVNRVRSNPGDPCILETQEPLQDLVRGVLKIFSSKTAPLGAKGWKPLVSYEKSNKSWPWIGPLTSSSDNDTIEEETSSEAWGLPHKMLVKLVDAFANWLKSGQETLQQIGSLPAPPASMLSNLDEKERFKDLRAQKSLNTISPSSDEVKRYFRHEELLRYSVPDRAFSYTAADGKKSIVAPLRRGGGKPTSKARDHFMLKPDRPPHVTILCLVRDAAARLPGSIGTRADVCTLIRDSQYIVEDVSDAQVNQVVSGALDRLHYERDPCVQFDADRKLWVYLHRDREEEDFEDDGTSSTKKWKRQRRDATDPLDNVQATGDPAVGVSSAGYYCDTDLNVDLSSVREENSELVYNDMRPEMENMKSLNDTAQGNRSSDNSGSWEPLQLNSLQENKMLCQENSTNEDFDDGSFSRERQLGLLSTSLL
ncbi:uncharacterized protein [Typha latifolia]|uniref:uncharacterized protein n=1 Tax=Typha latifolia TaxID=4733 RepID=UPI003C30BBAD